MVLCVCWETQLLYNQQQLPDDHPILGSSAHTDCVNLLRSFTEIITKKVQNLKLNLNQSCLQRRAVNATACVINVLINGYFSQYRFFCVTPAGEQLVHDHRL